MKKNKIGKPNNLMYGSNKPKNVNRIVKIG
jgi:hypothetical protein